MNPVLEKQLAAIRTVAPTVSIDQATRSLQTFRLRVVSPQQLTPDRRITLGVLQNLLPRIFQNLEFVTGESASSAGADMVLQLDESPNTSPMPTLYVGSSGWAVYLGTRVPKAPPLAHPNPLSAFMAASFAASAAFTQAFKEILNTVALPEAFQFDVLRLRPVPEPIQEPLLPEVVPLDFALVGVGAVGQALLASLETLNMISGNIRLIDPDSSEQGNEQRCMLANPQNRGQAKTAIARKFLIAKHPFLLVDTPLPAPLGTVASDYAGYRLLTRGRSCEPLVVAAVDNPQARRDIQAGLHRVILNGWTETSKGILAYGISRHELSNGRGCLACEYVPTGDADEATIAAVRTGWPREECLARLNDPGRLTTAEEVATIGARWNVQPDLLTPYINRPFADLLHGQCGLMTFMDTGSTIVAPVTQVPALVGGFLSIQVVAESLGWDTVLRHKATFDAFNWPTADQFSEYGRIAGCFCSRADVQQVYESEWGTKQ